VVDDDALFEFYDDRIPASVTSARHFDSWWKKARLTEPGLLTFSPGDLIGPAAGQIQPADYPVQWGQFPLTYEFAPGEQADGVTVDVPLATLNQVSAAEFSWLVPGLREELVTELIRSLPKGLRTAFVPAPDTARTVLARLGEPRGDVLEAVGRELERLGGVAVPRSAFDLSKLPRHLRITFRVTDGDRELAAGKDLTALRAELAPRLRRTLSDAAQGLTRTGLRAWDVGTLPRVFEHGQVRAYPALADDGDSVAVRLFETRPQADASMLRGTRRLIQLQVTSGARGVASRLPVSAKLAMSRAPYSGAIALLDDCAACAADEIIAAAGGPAWDEAGFARLLEAGRMQLATVTARVVSLVAKVLAQAQETETALSQARSTSPAMSAAIADMRAQLAGLIYEGFVSDTGSGHLADLIRYLRGISWRLDRAPGDLVRDAERMAIVHEVTQAWQDTRKELAAAGRPEDAARPVRWQIEELRVSLFAQTLGTPVRVSERRILTALDDLTA
jgi:ATP-dependent helicase HrpA